MNEKTRYERAQEFAEWAARVLEGATDRKTLADAVKQVIMGGVREIARD